MPVRLYSEGATNWSAELVIDERGVQLLNGQWRLVGSRGNFTAKRLTASVRSSSDPDDAPNDPSITFSPSRGSRTPMELSYDPHDSGEEEYSEEEGWEDDEVLDDLQEELQRDDDRLAQIDILEEQHDQISKEEHAVARRGGRSLHTAEKLRVARAKIAERIMTLRDARVRAHQRREETSQEAAEKRKETNRLKLEYRQLKHEGLYDEAHKIWLKIQRRSCSSLETAPQRNKSSSLQLADNEKRRARRAWRHVKLERSRPTERQISKGQAVLMQLRTALLKQNRAELRRLSKEFYRLLPDTKGRQNPPLLDNDLILAETEAMLAKQQMDQEIDTVAAEQKLREERALESRMKNRSSAWRRRQLDDVNERKPWQLRAVIATARRNEHQARLWLGQQQIKLRRSRRQVVHGGYKGAFYDDGSVHELEDLTLTELIETAIEGAELDEADVNRIVDEADDQGLSAKKMLIDMIENVRWQRGFTEAAMRGYDVPIVQADVGYRPWIGNRR